MKKPKRLANDEIWMVLCMLKLTTGNVEERSYILEGIRSVRKGN